MFFVSIIQAIYFYGWLGCEPFVNSLFSALRSKSYIPYTTSSQPSSSTNAAASSSDAGIPIPLDAFISPASPGRGQKRGLDDSDSYQQGPSKGARLTDGSFAGHPQQNGHGLPQVENGSVWQGGDGFGGMGMGMGRGTVGRRLPNGVCRDYHSACCVPSSPTAELTPCLSYSQGLLLKRFYLQI